MEPADRVYAWTGSRRVGPAGALAETREIVLASTPLEAAQCAGTSDPRTLPDFSESQNYLEREVAATSPGDVFWRRKNTVWPTREDFEISPRNSSGNVTSLHAFSSSRSEGRELTETMLGKARGMAAQADRGAAPLVPAVVEVEVDGGTIQLRVLDRVVGEMAEGADGRWSLRMNDVQWTGDGAPAVGGRVRAYTLSTRAEATLVASLLAAIVAAPPA